LNPAAARSRWFFTDAQKRRRDGKPPAADLSGCFSFFGVPASVLARLGRVERARGAFGRAFSPADFATRQAIPGRDKSTQDPGAGSVRLSFGKPTQGEQR
jgi:hypothetical protein